MGDVVSIDPRTGETVEVVAQETTTEEVDRLAAAALAAAAGSRRWAARAGRGCSAPSPTPRGRRDDVVAVADRESGLGPTRLNGELTRTGYQLRLFAEVLEEGGYLEATIDHAGATPMGPRPDLRRMLVPIGPVAVFGASNFPLAFSVPGGDTASALAAGCPVIVKAHGSHPATSQLSSTSWSRRPARAGAPDGTLGIVHGLQAGADLVAHPAIRAVGFTGSVNGGRALLAIIEQRPDPIPFFGELSSLNPVVVTPLAAAERGRRSAPSSSARSPSAPASSAPSPAWPSCPPARRRRRPRRDGRGRADAAPQTLLNEGIAGSFGRISSSLADLPGVETVARGSEPRRAGFQATPLLLTTSAAELPHEVTEECFGPVAVVARYDDEKALFAALDAMPSSLTATVLRGEGETELPLAVSQELRHGRPARLRRLPDRGRRLVGPAPRRALAVDQLPAHLGRHQRDPPVPAAGHLAGRAAGGAPRGADRRLPGHPAPHRRGPAAAPWVSGSRWSAPSAACASTRTCRSRSARCGRPGSPSTSCGGTTTPPTGRPTTSPSSGPAGTTPGGWRSS